MGEPHAHDTAGYGYLVHVVDSDGDTILTTHANNPQMADEALRRARAAMVFAGSDVLTGTEAPAVTLSMGTTVVPPEELKALLDAEVALRVEHDRRASSVGLVEQFRRDVELGSQSSDWVLVQRGDWSDQMTARAAVDWLKAQGIVNAEAIDARGFSPAQVFNGFANAIKRAGVTVEGLPF